MRGDPYRLGYGPYGPGSPSYRAARAASTMSAAPAVVNAKKGAPPQEAPPSAQAAVNSATSASGLAAPSSFTERTSSR